MEETGQEEVRPGSANSDNGLDGGFVEVTEEDAQMAAGWEQSRSDPTSALDEDADLYGDDRAGGDEGGAGEGEEEAPDDEEKPLSPPPSPVEGAGSVAEGQLLDFGFGDAPVISDPPQTTYPGGDTLLVAGPPEPLLDFGDPVTGMGAGGGFDLSDPFAPATRREDMGFGVAPSSSSPGDIDDMFGSGPPEPRDPTPPPSPERDPTPSPPPERDPTPPPPPRDPTPPPPPERDPTPPPPPPPCDPTPPPTPPPKDPTPAQPPAVESSGVEEVTPAPTPAPTPPAKKKSHMPKPRGYLAFLKTLHPVVLYIIYWRDMKLSAVVLGVCLVVLLTLTLNTILHTCVLLLLSFLVVSLTYIVSKIVIDSFYNKKIKNPFSTYLEKRITLPEDMLLDWALYAIRRMEGKMNLLVQLLLFANIKRSLAFGVCLWLASFVTNYLTLLSAMFFMVGVAFSVPWLYDCFQDHIDSHIDSTITKLGAISRKALVYLPFMSKKKAE